MLLMIKPLIQPWTKQTQIDASYHIYFGEYFFTYWISGSYTDIHIFIIVCFDHFSYFYKYQALLIERIHGMWLTK